MARQRDAKIESGQRLTIRKARYEPQKSYAPTREPPSAPLLALRRARGDPAPSPRPIGVSRLQSSRDANDTTRMSEVQALLIQAFLIDPIVSATARREQTGAASINERIRQFDMRHCERVLDNIVRDNDQHIVILAKEAHSDVPGARRPGARNNKRGPPRRTALPRPHDKAVCKQARKAARARHRPARHCGGHRVRRVGGDGRECGGVQRAALMALAGSSVDNWQWRKMRGAICGDSTFSGREEFRCRTVAPVERAGYRDQ